MVISRPSSRLLAKDWDALDDSDDDSREANVPRDMKYNRRNCERQQKHLKSLREVGGHLHDVYVCAKPDEPFWFVGKVGRVSDVTVQEAVARQWNLIEIHAANLRPLDLFASRGSMEIWVAPGDSEMEVAYNKPDLIFEQMFKDEECAVKNTMIGFQGEVYEGGEDGFRTWRTRDGKPSRPEVSGPPSPEQDQEEEIRAPTEEEMEDIQEKLKGMDINKVYEEQERRKRETSENA